MYLNAVLNTTCTLRWHVKFCINLTHLLIMYKSKGISSIMLYIKFTESPLTLKTCDIAHCHEIRRPRICVILKPKHSVAYNKFIYRMSSTTVLFSFHSAHWLYLRWLLLLFYPANMCILCKLFWYWCVWHWSR